MSFTSTGSHSKEKDSVPLVDKGVSLNAKYYVDFVVENKVIVELKSVAEVAKIHEWQVLTQLKLTALPVGLLINFNVPRLVDGVKTHRQSNAAVPNNREPLIFVAKTK